MRRRSLGSLICMNAFVRLSPSGVAKNSDMYDGGGVSPGGLLPFASVVGAPEWHGDLQNLRNVLQSAGANSVRSHLVFVHLLEAQTQRVTEHCLAHT
jgi:hypothetical protein